MKAEDLKLVVKDKYKEIALQGATASQSSCCGTSPCCGDNEVANFSDDYATLEGYNPDADMGLGCGLPTQYAGIKKGDHVLDLGSGAGNDCFVARTIVGEEGKVTGLDFTEAMVEKARQNLVKTGYGNIEFVEGDIEEMPLSDNEFDVVISNCVLNLVPDKQKAFGEIFRVLKPGGHFCISDIVLAGTLPASLQEAAEMYAGCVSGALQKNEYLGIIESAGFKGITVHEEKQTNIPNDLLVNYMTPEEIARYQQDSFGIFSITVNATKPESR